LSGQVNDHVASYPRGEAKRRDLRLEEGLPLDKLVVSNFNAFGL
jgi:hypothetical protein